MSCCGWWEKGDFLGVGVPAATSPAAARLPAGNRGWRRQWRDGQRSGGRTLGPAASSADAACERHSLAPAHCMRHSAVRPRRSSTVAAYTAGRGRRYTRGSQWSLHCNAWGHLVCMYSVDPVLLSHRHGATKHSFWMCHLLFMYLFIYLFIFYLFIYICFVKFNVASSVPILAQVPQSR